MDNPYTYTEYDAGSAQWKHDRRAPSDRSGRQRRAGDVAREAGPDFIEALARGLDVLRCFQPGQPVMTLSEIAAATGLARPTVRRILLTLEELGYVRVRRPRVRADPAGTRARHGVHQRA